MIYFVFFRFAYKICLKKGHLREETPDKYFYGVSLKFCPLKIEFFFPEKEISQKTPKAHTRQ
jgi:hypothetical protein